MKKFLTVVAVFAALLSCMVSFAQEVKKELPKEQVLAIATEAVKGKGLDLEDVNIIYDEGGQLWSERIGAAVLSNQPNHGILVKGFLKNYEIVYFDYKEPLPDAWVFVDRDTGDVFTVYVEE